MGSSKYSEQPAQHKQTGTGVKRLGVVAIPSVFVRRETDKGLLCDFGDDVDHWVAKAQVAQRSQVKRAGDRGWLVVTDWWARLADIAKYARPQSLEDRFPNFGRVLQELDARLPRDDPERKDINSLCDALHKDLGITPAGLGGRDDGKHGQGTTS
jgi:hypothetical protein